MRPREIYRLGIASVDDYCRANYQDKSFAELSQSDRFLTCLLTCAIALLLKALKLQGFNLKGNRDTGYNYH